MNFQDRNIYQELNTNTNKATNQSLDKIEMGLMYSIDNYDEIAGKKNKNGSSKYFDNRIPESLKIYDYVDSLGTIPKIKRRKSFETIEILSISEINDQTNHLEDSESYKNFYSIQCREKSKYFFPNSNKTLSRKIPELKEIEESNIFVEAFKLQNASYFIHLLSFILLLLIIARAFFYEEIDILYKMKFFYWVCGFIMGFLFLFDFILRSKLKDQVNHVIMTSIYGLIDGIAIYSFILIYFTVVKGECKAF